MCLFGWSGHRHRGQLPLSSPSIVTSTGVGEAIYSVKGEQPATPLYSYLCSHMTSTGQVLMKQWDMNTFPRQG